MTIISVVLAGEPFRSEVEATSWLQKVGIEPDETFRDLFATLDRLLAAESAAVGRPYTRRWDEDDALAARFGYGDGTETADARMRAGLAIDVRGGTEAPRRERIERSMPLRRIAAVLRGREPLRTCELLVPRVSSDLAAGRTVAAAAGIEAAVSTTVEEMAGLADDDEHLADIANLRELLPELTEVSRQVATSAKAWPGLAGSLAEPVAIAERVLRRIRALDP